MKSAITAIAATAWVIGISMAGATTPSPIWNIIGLIVFAGSSGALVWNLRRE